MHELLMRSGHVPASDVRTVLATLSGLAALGLHTGWACLSARSVAPALFGSKASTCVDVNATGRHPCCPWRNLPNSWLTYGRYRTNGSRHDSGRGGGFDTSAFAVEWDHQRDVCPDGVVSRKWRALWIIGHDYIQVKFAQGDCRARPAHPGQSQRIERDEVRRPLLGGPDDRGTLC
ncbi:hypothetical protein [Streptomyces sp. NPDC059466]|uniref:hypothetical protein n=1 Tax=unclassified Streptomyces TaxID=2593676 RepID=UPI00369DA298